MHEDCPVPTLYVLTNDAAHNGAACVLYPDKLKDLADEFGSDLLILPSSIHEVLIIADSENFTEPDYHVFCNTIKNVNRESIQPMKGFFDTVIKGIEGVLQAVPPLVMLMLIGLILRGVAFDFRVKAKAARKPMWDWLFFTGSTLASATQGWMLGRYISGFGEGWNYPLFAAAIAVALPMAYVLLGATWLIMKTDGELQERAVRWARIAWAPMCGGLLLISMATPWISETVRQRWFELPSIIALSAIPLVTAILLVAVRALLGTSIVRGQVAWLPFTLLIVVFVLGFLGLAYSLYPYVVIDRLTIWQAASSPAALKVILIGVSISLPAIAAYTAFSYRVFRGKATDLRYA